MVFDLLIVLLLVLAAALGAWKGFAWQMAAVVSPLAGVALGWPLSARLAPHLGLDGPLARFAALGILYILISFAVYLSALAIRKRLERAQLAAWDHHLGAVAGALKGAALSIALTCLALTFHAELRGRVHASESGKVMAQVVEQVRPALPERARSVLDPFLEQLRPVAPDAAVSRLR